MLPPEFNLFANYTGNDMSNSMSTFLSHSDKHLHQKSSSQSDLHSVSLNSLTRSADDLSYPVAYAMKWRQQKLIVECSSENQQILLSSDRQKWLIDRLQNSPVKLIMLDLSLGEFSLESWAEACEQASKKAFLRLPAVPTRPQKKLPLSWWLKRRVDWFIAMLLLVVFSPVTLGLILLLRLESSEPVISRQWCVGERGKLFRCFKFRTALGYSSTSLALKTESAGSKDAVSRMGVGQWLNQMKLDRLPLLLNVLRGEMSLVGVHPLAVGDAVQISSELRQGLNALPGIVGIRSMKKKSRVGNSCSTYPYELAYLKGWSLKWDFKLLLMTVPKLILTLSTD